MNIQLSNTNRVRAGLAALLILCLGGFGIAQEHKEEGGGKPSQEELQKAIFQLGKHIEAREHRVTELANDLLTLDQRSEARVGRIVESLERVTDSLESQTRVAETKKDAMEALERCMKHYEGRRKALKAETMKREPRITREELFSDIGRFDEKIEGRLEQIIGLTTSLQLHQDYEKYSYLAGDYDWETGGYYGYRNPRYYQNRKEVNRTEAAREKLLEELKSSLDQFERRNREIKGTLAKDITPEYHQMLLDELDANNNLITKRGEQIGELAFPPPPVANPIGRDHALNIEDVVEDMADDVERDCNSIWRLYIELNQERQNLRVLRDRLAHYEDLLKTAREAG